MRTGILGEGAVEVGMMSHFPLPKSASGLQANDAECGSSAAVVHTVARGQSQQALHSCGAASTHASSARTTQRHSELVGRVGGGAVVRPPCRAQPWPQHDGGNDQDHERRDAGAEVRGDASSSSAAGAAATTIASTEVG